MNAQINFVTGLIVAIVGVFFLTMSVAFVSIPYILAANSDQVVAQQTYAGGRHLT